MINTRLSVLFACLCLMATSAFAQNYAGPTPRQGNLTWSAPNPVGGSGTISSYKVYRGTAHLGPYAFVSSAPTGLHPNYTDTGSLSDAANYFWVVTTVDSNSNESSYSNEAQATMPSNPTAPQNPWFTTTPGSVTFGWGLSQPSSMVNGYNVYRGTVTGGPYSKIGSAASGLHPSYTDTTGTRGNTYFYIITGLDNCSGTETCESAASSEMQVTIP